MRNVYVAPELARGQLIVDLLSQHGIRARLLNTHATTLAGEIPVAFTGPQVWVDDDRDASLARQLIEDMESASSTHETRVCPGCDEENPVTFESCWQCGASFNT